MASPNQWTWVWINPGVGDGQEGLACCSSWGHKEFNTTERLNWTELSIFNMCVLVAQLCPTLCNLMVCSPSGSSVHRILQARILEWIAISFSRGSSHPRDRTQVSCTAGRFFTSWATASAAKLLQSCLTLCDPMDSSPPDSSAHGILYTRILECVAISFSKLHHKET